MLHTTSCARQSPRVDGHLCVIFIQIFSCYTVYSHVWTYYYLQGLIISNNFLGKKCSFILAVGLIIYVYIQPACMITLQYKNFYQKECKPFFYNRFSGKNMLEYLN